MVDLGLETEDRRLKRVIGGKREEKFEVAAL